MHTTSSVVLFVQCSDATHGSCIKVNGTLVPSEHDKQAVEVRAESIEVIGSCDRKVSFTSLIISAKEVAFSSALVIKLICLLAGLCKISQLIFTKFGGKVAQRNH